MANEKLFTFDPYMVDMLDICAEKLNDDRNNGFVKDYYRVRGAALPLMIPAITNCVVNNLLKCDCTYRVMANLYLSPRQPSVKMELSMSFDDNDLITMLEDDDNTGVLYNSLRLTSLSNKHLAALYTALKRGNYKVGKEGTLWI